MCADSRRTSRGVSLVELLVALVIAMLIGLVAVGSATAFGAAQRQAVSASATSAELSSALAAIKAEAGTASLGFFVAGVNRCARLNLVDAGVTLDNAAFVPLQVSRVAGSHFDQLDIVVTSDVKAATSVKLVDAAAVSANALKLRGWMPVQAGERVLIAPQTPGGTCTVRSVTGTVDAVPGGAPFTVNLAAASFSVPSAGYLPNDEVSALGSIDRRSIQVTGGQLVMTGSTLPVPVVLAENVVAWRVQYGVADPAGGITWTDPTGAWATLGSTAVGQVRALRMGLVARSPARDKSCQATTDAPGLFGASIDLSADPEWMCHRYRRAELVVPLRNLAWGQS